MGVPTPIPMGIKDRNVYQTFIKLAKTINLKQDRSTYELAHLDARVAVKKASDLSGVLDTTKVYFIDGVIDMGTTQIKVPEGGLTIRGFGFGVSRLVSTVDNYDMFIVDPAGAYSGYLFTDSIEIEVSGTGSKVYNLDNAGNDDAVESVTVNYVNTISLGELANYRQGLWSNVGLVNCVDGLTLTGTWSGFASLTSIIVAAPTAMTGTLFKAGAGLTMDGSFRSDMNALGLAAGGTFCDFAPANILNDDRFNMTGVRTEATNAFPNMPASSVKARYFRCVGIANTYVGMAQTVGTAGTTATLVAGTYVNNPATAMIESEEYWWDGGVANSGIYLSDQPVDISVVANLSFSGGSNDDMTIKIRKYDAALASYVDISPIFGARLSGGAGANKIENIGISAYTNIKVNDRIEIWIANNSGTTPITILAGGQIRIQER
jgi:hypothetical protein